MPGDSGEKTGLESTLLKPPAVAWQEEAGGPCMVQADEGLCVCCPVGLRPMLQEGRCAGGEQKLQHASGPSLIGQEGGRRRRLPRTAAHHNYMAAAWRVMLMCGQCWWQQCMQAINHARQRLTWGGAANACMGRSRPGCSTTNAATSTSCGAETASQLGQHAAACCLRMSQLPHDCLHVTQPVVQLRDTCKLHSVEGEEHDVLSASACVSTVFESTVDSTSR